MYDNFLGADKRDGLLVGDAVMDKVDDRTDF
jgi:hypothetical protein